MGFRAIVFIFILISVSANISSGFLQVFVELWNLHGTSTFIESTGVTCSDSGWHNWVQVLSIPVL